MNYDARIESLRSKKAGLEKALDSETKRPYPDPITVTEIKRQKLRIKDEIDQYTAHATAH